LRRRGVQCCSVMVPTTRWRGDSFNLRGTAPQDATQECPAKKIVPGDPQKSKLGLPYSSQLRGFWPSHIMIETHYSDVTKDICIIIIWLGKKTPHLMTLHPRFRCNDSTGVSAAKMQQCTAKVSTSLLNLNIQGEISTANQTAQGSSSCLSAGYSLVSNVKARKMLLCQMLARDMTFSTRQWIACKTQRSLSPITTRRPIPSTLSSLSSNDGDVLRTLLYLDASV